MHNYFDDWISAINVVKKTNLLSTFLYFKCDRWGQPYETLTSCHCCRLLLIHFLTYHFNYFLISSRKIPISSLCTLLSQTFVINHSQRSKRNVWESPSKKIFRKLLVLLSACYQTISTFETHCTVFVAPCN